MRITLAASFASLEGHFGLSASTPLLSYLTGGDRYTAFILPMDGLITFSAEITKPIGLGGQAEVASITVDIDIT